MDKRHIIVFDLETGSSNQETAVILQIAAAAINRYNLNIIDRFNILIKPGDEDWALIEDKALEVNHLTRAQLDKDGTVIEDAFPLFAEWIRKFNTSKDKKNTFGSPIASGFGIINFDMPIFNRYCKRFGCWDEKWNNQNLLNPIFIFDVMHHIWFWFRNNEDISNIKLGTVLEYCGLTKEEIEGGAHSADWDVEQTSRLAIKLLRMGNYMTDVVGEKRRMEIKGCLSSSKNQ